MTTPGPILCSLLAAVCVAAGASVANAVPPTPQLVEPCVTLNVSLPGESFPLNLYEQISFTPRFFNEYRSIYANDDPSFAVDPLPIIEREVDGAWIVVDAEIEDLLGTGPRDVLLLDPQPGGHRLVWAALTCDGPQAETGSGTVLRTWSLTEFAPAPTSLGALTAEWREGLLHVSLDWDDEAVPWAFALALRAWVDAEDSFALGAGLRTAATQQTHSWRYSYLCPLDEVEATLRNGPHSLRVTAVLDDGEQLATDETSFTVSCPPPTVDETALPPPPAERETSLTRAAEIVGCTTTHPTTHSTPGPLCSLLAVLALLSVRRARARRP